MAKVNPPALSRRERQIMDVLYQVRRASAAEVQALLPEAPGYSAVRALLRILEGKGHVRHEEESGRYIYLPAVPRERAKRQALAHLIETYFDGSVEQAVATLLDRRDSKLSGADLDRLAGMIERSRKGER